MLQYIVHQMFINQTLVLLAGIHQTSVADAVDPPGNPRGFSVDFIQCFVGKYVPSPSGVNQM